jgi:hypothetical protein
LAKGIFVVAAPSEGGQEKYSGETERCGGDAKKQAHVFHYDSISGVNSVQAMGAQVRADVE